MSISLSAIVRQHAASSKFFGVDFVPVYRSRHHAVEVTDEAATVSDTDTRGASTSSSESPLLEAANTPSAPPAAARRPMTRTPSRPDAAVPPAPPVAATRRPAARDAADVEESVQPVPPRTAAAPTRRRDVYVPAAPLPGWNERQVAAFEKLEAIRKRYIEDAPHQHFVTDHHSIVFGDGDPCARLMFIGEAPGADEDRVGKPFVGRAGQLLEKMIVAMGLTRQQVYIANVLKTRPPNNATPTLEEAQLCAPYLFDQVVAVSPLVIVTLGLPATRLVLKTDLSMSALRGRWASFTHKGVTVPVMPTYHPAFLLRSYTPENRGKVWSDLQQAMSKLGMSATAQPGEQP